ncbi:MAG: phosphoenolpyruvate synthase [Patescibacteria group bacterium]
MAGGKLLVWFAEVSKGDIALVGGKGANLGEMTKASLPVPPGFIVTADAYYEFLRATKLDRIVKKELTNLDPEDSKKLNVIASTLQKAIQSHPLPGELAKQIVKSYDDMGQGPVAVRSSATAEDLPSIAENEPALVKINGQIRYFTMGELWKCYNDQQQILVPALADNKINWYPVQELYRHHAKTKLAKITTATGREITITPDHSLIIQDQDGLGIRAANINELNTETRLPVAKNIPTSPRRTGILNLAELLGEEAHIDEEGLRLKSGRWQVQKPIKPFVELDTRFAYLLGVFAAEGSIYNHSTIDFSCESVAIANKIKPVIKSLGLVCASDPKNVRVHSRPLAAVLEKLFGQPSTDIKGKGKYSHVKRVPDIIFNCSPNLIGAYLKGHFDGDGYVGRDSVSVTSVSPHLRNGTALLLSLLDVKCRLDDFDITVLLCDVSKFKEMIGFTEQKKQERLETVLRRYEQRQHHNDHLDTLPITPGLARAISQAVEPTLPQRQYRVGVCNDCNGVMRKNGHSSSSKQRWMCSACSVSVSEGANGFTDRFISERVVRDQLGRFSPDTAPWNKGSYSATKVYTKTALAKLAIRHGVSALNGLITADVIWDRIKKIEPIDYDGYVYDFVVPGPQNFLSGYGGIITHNSASFAGQQETYLNIEGADKVIKAVRQCWASLFGARAIYYRTINKFDHLKVGIAVPIQKMVQSEVSGIMFTADPVASDLDKIVIDAGMGLGEAIVSGSVTPDHYVVDKKTMTIVSKEVSKQAWQIVRNKAGKDVHISTPKDKLEGQKLSDEQIVKLATLGHKVETHYGSPQDMEWAFEGGSFYMVQSRPITTLKGQPSAISDQPSAETEKPIAESGELKVSEADVLVTGAAASVGRASGPVKVIHKPSEIDQVLEGDVLVTEMTSPDYVPAMRRACAIVTDTGGRTSHASIVSRELGIPCVVGTGNATNALKTGQVVTVDGASGKVYKGKIQQTAISSQPSAGGALQARPVGGYVTTVPVTATKVYLNLAEPTKADEYAQLPVDGVGLLRAEFIIANIGEHPHAMMASGRSKEYVQKLSEGIGTIAQAFNPRPVVYRFTDFKTNEYKSLKGGEKYEEQENNPMIGYRGASRYILDPEEFALEIEAIKAVRDGMDLKNLHVMIPFVRRVDEFTRVRDLMHKNSLKQGPDFKLWIMVEVPSTIFEIQKYIDEGIDGISIGSNDLTQLILGIDRDSSKLASEFDERYPAVMGAMIHVIKTCRKANVTASICGQAPSVYPEVTEALVKAGTTSVSVAPDVAVSTRKLIASVEKKLILSKVIDG